MWSIKQKFSLKSRTAYIQRRVLSIVTVGLMAGSILVSGFFIYQNIYRTLSDANVVILLNSAASIDAVDVTEYDKAEQLLALKHTPLAIAANARDIFMYDYSTSTVSAATSTKK